MPTEWSTWRRSPVGSGRQTPRSSWSTRSSAHRGLVQPAAEIIALAREHGVPVWLDAAQSVGHVAVPPGADAVVATSRKWLTGPRGVGMVAVAEQHRPHLRVRRPAKLPDVPDHPDARVAGGPCRGTGRARGRRTRAPRPRTGAVADRLADVGRAVREMAATVDGWEVVHPHAPAVATTSLRPTRGQDAEQVHEVLLHEHDILTSVCLPWRAPGERIDEPWLRLSPARRPHRRGPRTNSGCAERRVSPDGRTASR